MGTRFFFLFCLIAMLAFVSGCTENPNGSGKVVVAVSILPQLEFVEAVGKDRVEAIALVPPGADPHTYELTPAQLVRLSQADLYIKVGTRLPIEEVTVPRLKQSNANMAIINSSEGLETLGDDPHVWLSPRNAMVMVNHTRDGLIAADPTGEPYYTENAAAYIGLLQDLDNDISASVARMEKRKFIVFHPAWGYLARDYQMTQVAIGEEGKEPQAADIARIIETAKAENISVIFVEPQFDAKSAQVIADEIDGTVISIDPLAKDYISNLQTVSETIAQSAS
jgi:zinc transport system substrate-binding protein